MVIKGNPRGSPGGLAAHLQRTDTNERMEVKEIRGVVATDLTGALQEMDAHGAALRTSRTLYHASINTRADERLTDEQRTRAIDQLEDKLGLTGQARAVVMHEKEGREHFHIVWARTDLDGMRAIRCDHNYRKHEEVARALEQEFGHARVQGAHAERDGKERPERTPSHAEMQQAERTELTPQEAKEQITAIWQRTDNGKAFAAALEQAGWLLALGDRRDFVVIDSAGETHSLARRVEGAKAKDIRARMADVDAATLPDVEQAREQQRARDLARQEIQNTAAPALPTPEPQQRPQQAEPELPATPLPELQQETRAELRSRPIPEPDGVSIVAPTEQDNRPLEPDPSHVAAEARGDATAEGISALPLLAPEVSDSLADRGSDGVQATEQDHRADETTAGDIVPAHNDAPSSIAATPDDDVDIVRGVLRGASVLLDAAAKVTEGAISFLDGLVGGGGGKPAPKAAPPPERAPDQPAMTARQRRDARLKAFLEADQQQRQAARQQTAHRLGASEALTEDELRREQEAQEKRRQEQGGGISR